jgi:hypothetical protein
MLFSPALAARRPSVGTRHNKTLVEGILTVPTGIVKKLPWQLG